MIYWNQSEQINMQGNRTVIVMGKFDGVHLGHQKLFNCAKKEALARNAKALAFTFDCNISRKLLVTTNEERRLLIEEQGMDVLLEYPFVEIMNMEAEQFVKEILVDKLNACMIIAGTDCGFGKNRSGNIQLLQETSVKYGFELQVVDKVWKDDIQVSSTNARNLIEQGQMEIVNGLLGRPYFVTGQVVKGNQIGRTWDFPTINMIPASDKLIPPNGVYASKVLVDGIWKNSITNIGKKPTVDSQNEMITIETFIFDFDENLYNQTLKVELHEFIRPEKKFGSFDELKEQIRKDIVICKEYFR